MKKIILLFFIIQISTTMVAQVVDGLKIHDTRSQVDNPTMYNREVRFDFKFLSTINAPGSGLYSGLMTIAPWADNSGNKSHQLNFNDGGIFYRNGNPEDTNWGPWDRVLTSNNETNNDAVLTFNNTDNLSQYFQFKRSGSRMAWVGLGSGNNFNISKEGGGHIILRGANVGIGTTIPSEKLEVNGTIRSKEVTVESAPWPDYVFSDTYKLSALSEVSTYIQENHHLPGIPIAEEVKENGIKLGEMNAKLLEKIEELTLYQIDLLQKLNQQNEEIVKMKKTINQLLSSNRN